ncbi:hypothetical protein EJ02DRAFT_435790 [Clathrospora elynae]|uniref:Uncharacterized protein n=1 Tax=Clathrospora elynae TaxID=706981 RepID=A0A6A5SHT0_9PLEO|nr:hypothetical protein EJ02DRAFT_435790 [Clathrospora elynae]
MTGFLDLSAELRFEIPEYVLTAIAWLDPPNIDALRPEQWTYLRPPPDRQSSRTPIVRIFRCLSNHRYLVSVLLISRAFAEDVAYVWRQMVKPQLVPVLNVDYVGHAVQMHICIRHFDHQLLPSGTGLNVRRCYEDRIPGHCRTQLLLVGVIAVLQCIRALAVPGLVERRVEVLARIKPLKLFFDTNLPEGLYWSPYTTTTYRDPEASFSVS